MSKGSELSNFKCLNNKTKREKERERENERGKKLVSNKRAWFDITVAAYARGYSFTREYLR